MSPLVKKFTLPVVIVAGVFSLIGSAPAHAADFTIDCSGSQGAPYTDYDADPGVYYGVWDYVFDGTQEQTVTVNILNCGYHFVRHPAGTIVSGYFGPSTNDTYTITLPVDGIADAWGYNIGDSPQFTTFIINMSNPTPTDGGGGDPGDGGGDPGDGGGDPGDGGGDPGDGGGDVDSEDTGSSESAASTLPETGFNPVMASIGGLLAITAGAALVVVRQSRRRVR